MGTKVERDQTELYSSHEFAPMLLRVFGLKKTDFMGKLGSKKIQDPQKKGGKEDGTRAMAQCVLEVEYRYFGPRNAPKFDPSLPDLLPSLP
ncbi:hypothetical protein N7533_004167 [Penicillium manginii]|jgi:hypothetical protein|uniref:uncharacterized protein n=1 Tax=Penicillium manginii TaxID=203109 RepID=UPI002546BFB9|nr:uncharacterized protein N7533_004167 [Penicillium manginii]KAJ5754624.1 hypothetical protein N7533_004167 [Penicillium manginii]